MRFALMLIAMLLVFTCSITQAQDDDLRLIMETAEVEYRNGNLDRAIGLYRTLIQRGVHDAAVYFNMGQTYYELGDFGHARLHFYRAQSLNPNDFATTIGLNRVALSVPASAAEDPLYAHVNLARLTQSLITTHGFMIAMLGYWSAWFVGAGLWLVMEKRPLWLKWTLGISGIIMVAGLILLAARVYILYYEPHAVVLETTTAWSGPGEQFVPMYEVPAATEGYVTDIQDSWVRLVQLNGRPAWFAAPDVATVRIDILGHE